MRVVAPPQRFGAEVAVRRGLIGNPKRRVTERELGDDLLVLVAAADPVVLGGSERRLVEVQCGAAMPD